MTASFNVSGQAVLPTAPQSTPLVLTIPSSVLSGDGMIVGVTCFGFTGDSSFGITLTPTVGSWTRVGPIANWDDGSLSVNSAVYVRQAGASDPGTNLSFVFTGTPGTNEKWWAGALGAWTGLDITQIDFAKSSGAQGGTNLVATPTLTTTHDNAWAIYLALLGTGSGGAISTQPSGTTLRVNANTVGIAAAIADSNAGVGLTGTNLPSLNWTNTTQGGWLTSWTLAVAPPSAPPAGSGAVTMKKATVSGTGTVSDTFSVTGPSTDGNGVKTYQVTSSSNNTGSAGAQPMRVLNPTSPASGFAHSFLYMLPVEPGQGTSFGDTINMARIAGWHNTYNLTIIQPGFPIDPWFADNPGDPSTHQETFMVSLQSWVAANLETTGTENHYIIGFSKSGIGGASLLFRHPTLFYRGAFWDFPADMTSGARFDPDSTAVYGSDPNFQNNYELNAANIASWKVGQFTSKNRIWIGGESEYGTEVADYDTLLTNQGVPHTYTYNVNESHAWATDWVSAALLDMIESNSTTGTGAVTTKKPTLAGYYLTNTYGRISISGGPTDTISITGR
jgi:hypothetical protein